MNLETYLKEARSIIDETHNYALAFGFLETAVETFLKGGEENGD